MKDDEKRNEKKKRKEKGRIKQRRRPNVRRKEKEMQKVCSHIFRERVSSFSLAL